jgi:cell division septation protein DedD
MTALGLSEGGDERSPRPPVHYQISVTGRQAAVFFFVLLVALSLAFFFGMKTGAAAHKGPGAVAALATASDLPVPTLAPSESPREDHRPEKLPERPAEESLGFAATPKAASPTSAPEPTAAPAPAKVATPVPAKAPTVAPTPVRTAAVKETPAKPVAKGPFYVQVLATKKAPAADELMKRLKEEGFAADVSPVPGKDGWFRVRVGPFKDRAKAEAAARKIKLTDKQIKNTPLVVP